MKIKDLFPIGTIVLLKNGQKRLMICGVMQIEDSGFGKEYDYLGVLYPEGYMGDQHLYLFNHEDIETMVFYGFDDFERQDFLKKLAEQYK